MLAPKVIKKGVLSREHLSQLYQHAALARLMGITPAELAHVQELLRVPRAVERPAERIPHILMLLGFKQALDETPFSISDVLWMVAGEVSGDTGPQVDQAQVDGLLERVRKDPMRFFTPDSFAEIEGVSLVQAQALVAILAQAQGPLNWLVRTDEAQERYSVTSAYSLNPDLEPVVAFFVSAGDSPDAAAGKADDVQQQLGRHHPHAIFVAHLTEEFNINQAYLEALRPFLTTDPADEAFITLLFSWLEPADETDTQALLELMRALEQLLYLFQGKLDLSAQSLDFVATQADIFALTLPFGLEWGSLRLLSIYKEFLPAAPEEAADLHQALTSWTGEELPEASWPLLVKVLKTDLVQIRSLLGTLILPATSLDAVVTLKKALKLTSKLGLNGAALNQLTAKDYAGLQVANTLVYGAIRAKYEEKEWAEVIEPYEDKLNMIKRDALVDRILSKEFQLKFNDARELYQFFLLDVEMDGCARTSRVLEAISACQLYVHRCRMNLEQSEAGDVHVFPDTVPADQWLWRKNYRVWEANRKVFLYPENWLEPDLRDNKTPIFKQAESELLQSTITPDAIEKIYRNYLREYAELAKVIIVSTVYDDNEDAYLFFAHTPGKPFQYYWRKLLRNVEWGAWQKIELEIESAVVSAHKHHGKLYLFWIQVLTNNDKDQGHSATTYIEDNQTIYLEYAFLESNGKWTTPGRVPFHNITVINLDSDFSGNFETIPKVEVDSDGAAQIPVISKTALPVARHYDKVYPHTAPNDSQIRLFQYYSSDEPGISARLDEYSNR
ncbi:MAG: neuraminidase-like domain-containing protein, partial [Pyrinomonadaceae bacterium]